ncbi:cytochrome c biogenesis protein ResB [Streptomyces galbus]|uniref:Cytochrome c biogenesis protein ResB n=1 Tax=Streptomyces galbus TaxID=33898 RepID=A0A4V6AY06_STRGB|nr:cytochrome c biogenesis protein ResB [Streptomyces galbus]TKT06723.1 cytochrome c biogenesis protein ResB [Streptomyces galbus]GHD49121.1 cytochrome c biosynthesis protein [Streptomyces galbus]
MSKTTAPTDPTGEQELAEAGSQLSTAPDESAPQLPALGVVGWARWFWRQLTSMRVALLLLLLLALAAIPGSLIPQTGTDATKVAAFRSAHTTLGPVYERLGLFHVYSSVWFSAIYILLFVSLIGCIVPRTWQFVGQVRSRPPGAPRRLTRLPAYTTWRTEASPEQVREAALALLNKRRFRAHTAGDAVAAEKGYLREIGNLAFHVALIVLLVAFGWGQLFKSEGNKLVVEGDGFSNTLTQYDDFKSGSLFTSDDLVPFSFHLDKFTGTYEMTGPNRGTARTFQAALTYSEGAYGKDKKTIVKVNHPLEIGDAKVYLTAHGYAPVMTVRDGKGDVVYRDAVPLLPLDNNVTSTGVVKVMDGYRNARGVTEQLGIKAFFYPTFGGAGTEAGSRFPALLNPLLNLEPYHGDLGVDSGIPQSVYQLDKTHMKDFKDAKGLQVRGNLKPGETLTLPGGAGSVTYEGTRQWANFQVVQEPGGGWALAGALTAIFGLAASLFIQRRRVWVRAVPGDDGVTVVEMAGLGRSESAKVPEELGDLAGLLYERAPGAPEPDPDPAVSPDPDPHVVPAEGAEQQ